MPVLALATIAFLIVLNGFFAMAELAVVSARRPRLAAMAEAGSGGARAALGLLENQARFLSSVQIGITLIGVLAGAFGGATLAEDLAGPLEALGLGPGAAGTVAVAVVVAVITYLSLIVGELVPKQIALADPERVAALVAGPMALVARVAAPAVWLLETSSRLVLRLLGRGAGPEQRVTEEEIRMLIAEGESAGVVETAEKHMIGRVMRLGDRSVRAVMTPRPELDWVDLDREPPEALARLLESPHSRLPAGRGTIDGVVGVLHARDVLRAVAGGGAVDLAPLVREAPVLHDRVDALDALEALRGSPVDMAFVVDEHGTLEGVVTAADLLEGVVTAADLLEAIAGRFAAREAEGEPDAVRREDGSWLLAGWMPVDDMAELLKVALPERRGYHTVAGFALGRLGRFPRLGDAFELGGWRFEVVDIDGRRIDKVLAQPLRAPPGDRLARRAALVAALALLAPRPAAATNGPETFVGGLGDRALRLLGRRQPGTVPRGEIAALFDEAVDLRLLARLVLGRHWNAAAEGQRREYLELFRAYALQGLTSAFATYAGLRRFVVTGARPAGDGDALVGSELHLEPGRPPYRVDWRVRDAGGRFVVVDVVAEGVSLLVTNRDEFNAIVGRGGIEKLLREMRGWREEGAGAAPGGP